MTPELLSLGFLVGNDGVMMDPKKTRTLENWPSPSNIKKARSFMGLASFYRKFIWNFGSITTPITDCFKIGVFHWTEQAEIRFRRLRAVLQTEPILALPNFDSLFELECGASLLGIGAILTQDGHPIAHFLDKLAESRRKWTTYEQELFAVDRA